MEMKLLYYLPRSPWLYLVLWFVWFGVLWWLSARHGTGQAPTIPHFDKVLHFGYFGWGGVFWFGFLRCKKNISARMLLFFSFLAGVLLGFIDEYHQTFTPGRDGLSAGDLIADTLGFFCGAVTLHLCFIKQRQMKK